MRSVYGGVAENWYINLMRLKRIIAHTTLKFSLQVLALFRVKNSEKNCLDVIAEMHRILN